MSKANGNINLEFPYFVVRGMIHNESSPFMKTLKMEKFDLPKICPLVSQGENESFDFL